jgi:hypothetical protein
LFIAALEAFNRAAWDRKMLELEGKVAIDVDALREDREFDEHGAGTVSRFFDYGDTQGFRRMPQNAADRLAPHI